MAKAVVVTQSNYLPWRGFFDLVSRADELVLLDSVQYTRRDWRNRNLIKTSRGTEWLTIPVQTKGRFHQSIEDTLIAKPGWCEHHIRALENAYRRAACFDYTAPWLFARLRTAAALTKLSQVNRLLIEAICDRLDIAVTIRSDREVLPSADLGAMDATARLVALVAAIGGDRYITGPSAADYLDVSQFEKAGIAVEWMSYEGYPTYPQCWGAFEPRVSTVDLLLNCGADAAGYLHPRG